MRNVLLALVLTGSTVLPSCFSSPPPPTSVRIRWPADPQTRDPLLVSSPQAIEAINLLHYSLLALDPRSLQVQPLLAESLPQVSRDNGVTRLTYMLRPQAAWDNGQPILARDVAYSLKVMNCPGLPIEAMQLQYGFVENIELDSANPRRFTFVCSSSSVRELLISTGEFAILPEYSLDPQGTLRTIPFPLLQRTPAAAVRQYPALTAFARRYLQARHELQPGCGPYKVADWKRTRYLRLQRKPQWWADKLPNPPTWLQARASVLSYQIIPDENTAILALRRNNIDLYPNPPAREFLARQQSQDSTQFDFQAADSYRMTVLGFNTESPALSEAATRRALSLLPDVDGIITATQPTLAYRSASLIKPRDTAAYNSSLPLLAFSPAQALQQLKAAGWQRRADNTLWRNGRQLAPSITYQAGNSEQETIALQFRTAAAQIGIPVSLHPTEASLLEQKLSSGQIEIFIQRLNGSPFNYNFQPILHSSAISLYNHARFRNAESDKLIAAISTETDPKRLPSLLRNFQSLLRQESPLVVLFFTSNRLISSRQIGSARTTSIQPGYDVLSLARTAP